ncbi:MAG: MFS transporter [Anaerolineae bacterium]
MTPTKIIRNYFIIAGLYTLSASLIWGVNTLFLLNAGLNIAGVFLANSAFSISMAVFEIPTGILADTSGRRVSFLFSVAVLTVGTLGYAGIAAAGGGLPLFVLASVVLGLGYTFYSGAVEAWLVDGLNAAGYDGKLDQVFARGSLVTGAAMLVGSVGGGFLGDLDLALPFLLRAAFLAILFVIAYFTMHDTGYTRRPLTISAIPVEVNAVLRASVKYGWQQRPVRLLMGVSFIQAIFTAWGFHASQPYLLALLGQDTVWVVGIISALVALSTMAGNSLVEWFTRYCGKRTTLLLWAAVIQAVAAVGMGLAGSFWLAVPSFLVMMVGTGITSPVYQAMLHRLIPSKQRATIVSFNSMIASGGSTLGQSSLGSLAQARSIGSGYVAGGLATLLAVPILGRLRRLGDPADVIVGTAGKRGACAAQGLPEITAVDTHVATAA